jgi:hypothetical protein
MRTTVDIDDPILKDLKKIQEKKGKSLGRLISDLLAQAIRERQSPKASDKPARWISREMGARIDLADREAVYAAMEQEPQTTERTKKK